MFKMSVVYYKEFLDLRTCYRQTDDDLALLFVKQALLDEEQRRQKPRENDFTVEDGHTYSCSIGTW